MKTQPITIAILGVIFCWTSTGAADPPNGGKPAASSAEESSSSETVSVDSPTWGGKQFWSDQLVFHGWRIQRNVFTGHCRLLDDHNVRRAAGTLPECKKTLEELKAQLQLPPLRPKAIVVLHGLCRSRDSMDSLCQYLKRDGEYEVLNVSYASTRDTLDAHAAALARVVENLDGVEEINFVAHSLGNLVIRYYLGDCNRRPRCPPTADRMGRFVMLAPPNDGAQLAKTFRGNTVFGLVWGDSGKQLAENWEELQPRLVTPRCEFGIIAGGRGDGQGSNPLLDGDDDFVVRVAETRLPGARDFLLVPAFHGRIMKQPQVQKATLHFIKHGNFISDDQRSPIVAKPAGCASKP